MGGFDFSKYRKHLPILAIGALFLIAFLVFSNPPEQSRRGGPVSTPITVEVFDIQPTDYQIELQSYGIVRARTQSALVSQVSGEIIWVNPQFREGGYFAEGDPLLRIDPRDYEADVNIARSSFSEAQRLFAEEEALAEQAVEEWKDLGNSDTPPLLVSRVPQLKAAKARVEAQRASLKKAQLALERTTITAPFTGRILSKSVDIGQVVSPNTALATVFATDVAEIRLPITNSDLRFLTMPQPILADQQTTEAELAKVKIHSRLGSEQTWEGSIVRIEGAIDEQARQLHVVAQVDDPFSSASPSVHPLKIGEYVTAEIEASVLEGAIVIPNGAIYQGAYVYVVEDNFLQRRDVDIAWQNDKDALIDHGLNGGDRLVVTPLGQVASGTRVQVRSESDANGSDMKSARDGAGDLQPDKKKPSKEAPS